MRRAKPEKEKKPQTTAKVSVSMRPVETECDVRGEALDDALMSVEAFLDGAILNRLREVSIIHGKGTGVLRKAVQQRLKSMPQVKSFRLGLYGEGEDGVTIATLR
jgi:DNA mismatch repair protein MutS2